MESKIHSELNVKTFVLQDDEIRNFAGFIRKIQETEFAAIVSHVQFYRVLSSFV